MIHYTAREASGARLEGWADRIRVQYTPEEINVFCLEGSNDYKMVLSADPGEFNISEFWCEKFALRAP